MKNVKKICYDFLLDAHEVMKNLYVRNKAKPYSLKYILEHFGFDFFKDRFDRSAFSKDGSYLWIVDIEAHKDDFKKTLPICLDYARKIKKIIPCNIKYSGRGINLIGRIENKDDVINFLLDRNIKRVCDLSHGLLLGLIRELKLEKKYFDFGIYTTDSSIRSFCLNDKIKIKGRYVFSVPVYDDDSINDILKRSVLLSDLKSDIFDIPVIPVDKLKYFERPPIKECTDKGVKKHNVDYDDVDQSVDLFTQKCYKRLPLCVRDFIESRTGGKFSFYDRKILVMFINSLNYSDKIKLGMVKNILGEDDYNHFKQEGNLQFFFGRDFKLKNCATLIKKGLCSYKCMTEREQNCDNYLNEIV